MPAPAARMRSTSVPCGTKVMDILPLSTSSFSFVFTSRKLPTNVVVTLLTWPSTTSGAAPSPGVAMSLVTRSMSLMPA